MLSLSHFKKPAATHCFEQQCFFPGANDAAERLLSIAEDMTL